MSHTPSRTRSPQRAAFLLDVLCTAVEDGCTNTWRQVSAWRWDCDPGEASVRVHEQGDCGEDLAVWTATIETIAAGLAAIRNGSVQISASMRAGILEDDRDNDCGYMDAYAADMVLQAGLYGELIYG